MISTGSAASGASGAMELLLFLSTNTPIDAVGLWVKRLTLTQLHCLRWLEAVWEPFWFVPAHTSPVRPMIVEFEALRSFAKDDLG
jgi:hypothetical protein